MGILQLCRDSSLLAQALQSSNQPTVLLETSLRKFSATTLSQYLRAVRIFLAFVAQCAGSLALLSLAHQASVQEDRFALKCSPLLMCKALSWLAHIGQIRLGRPDGEAPSPGSFINTCTT